MFLVLYFYLQKTQENRPLRVLRALRLLCTLSRPSFPLDKTTMLETKSHSQYTLLAYDLQQHNSLGHNTKPGLPR